MKLTHAGDKIDRNDKNIPAHLLGNMWAQSWVSLYDRIKPFNTSSDLDITASLQRNNFTALNIFQESDRFYKSLGLESNEMSFTGASIIEKPEDRLIVCHASAWVRIFSKQLILCVCVCDGNMSKSTPTHRMA